MVTGAGVSTDRSQSKHPSTPISESNSYWMAEGSRSTPSIGAQIVTRKIKVCKISFNPILPGMGMLKFISQRMPKVGGKSLGRGKTATVPRISKTASVPIKEHVKENRAYPTSCYDAWNGSFVVCFNSWITLPRMRSTSEIR